MKHEFDIMSRQTVEDTHSPCKNKSKNKSPSTESAESMVLQTVLWAKVATSYTGTPRCPPSCWPHARSDPIFLDLSLRLNHELHPHNRGDPVGPVPVQFSTPWAHPVSCSQYLWKNINFKHKSTLIMMTYRSENRDISRRPIHRIKHKGMQYPPGSSARL